MPKTSVEKKATKSSTSKQAIESPESGLRELFVDEVRDIYWAENHLVKALPKMQQAAVGAELAAAIAEHLEITKTHVARLEEIFTLLGEKAQAKKCDAMEGLTKEGEAVIEDTEEGSAARDAGIIMASQKVEHYEIAAYAGLIHQANTLGLSEVANLLAATLEEEKQADENLTAIADLDGNFTTSTEL